MHSRKKTAGFFRDHGGAAALEFALVGNAFLILLIGTAYLAIMMWHSANLNWAVQKAARLAVLDSSVTQSEIKTAVNDYLASVDMGPASVDYDVTTYDGVTIGKINATKTEAFNVPLLSRYAITFHATAKVPQP